MGCRIMVLVVALIAIALASNPVNRVLGLVALGFTLISVFTLSGPGPLSLLRRQVNEVA